MLKDRKFIMGVVSGLVAGGMLAFVQPLVAADQAGNSAELLKEVQALRKYTLDLAKQTRTIATDISEMKGYAKATSEGVSKLNERGQFK
ncbi:hypothetical protein COW36_08535 [bacterium (Candidatus Blackallbacteria) CG17_big_fil_post_rev_8_21_14_2_50_48_46]|uniref:Uncharacterized protein n=1 Tax=bacterium (Candidatus Blackallbacteria) CG17_big_fil_post_rev_8_21_14_2_50_48_46 TaxID=2014261 RepID=A0A2M7G6J7_9BACT|nr:MAG: hypothetical protein COW64_05835 [bacterium (Candidatus Blackallbacteria) CG18_big_fil_WC_8_21_14_2_50_49_26]PIW17533.1 MAG: hypothetical protein COW36_08535 [bacterium (Candidatus Blackallbacteria) CG17_big_fil_post_rev_8_21_14_2_50_48_46]PIW48388.1 MAG: hypothetical protein COW20_09885 [bacterium (Candidatus Blackallbacteria) CG13_big_fil_rev_8_21_14_2_50_49_14]